MNDLDVIHRRTPTAAGTETIRGAAPEERPTFASLVSKTAELRDGVAQLDENAKAVDRVVRVEALEESTALAARRDPIEVLEELAAEWGLSWTTIARMVGVSSTAVRKWRRGDPITGTNRRRLARVLAFLMWLRATYPVGDPASWLDMPIADASTLTITDLYAANRIDLVFELVGGRMNSTAVLDAFDPDWRVAYAADDRFEVVLAPDGEPAIVERGSSEA
jgi:hypothetical protein